MSRNTLIAAVVILLLHSCAEYKVKKAIVAFQNITFSIPYEVSHIPEYRLIVLFDSTVCNACGYNSLYLWNEIIQYGENNPDKLQCFFIFSPSEEEMENMKVLESSGIYDICVDISGLFSDNNPDYVNNPAFNTFLINKQGKPVLMGNPIFNNSLYKLYSKTLGMESTSDSDFLDNLLLASDSSLSFDREIYHIGHIIQGETVDVSLIATNNTSEDIMITNVESDCKCLSVDSLAHKIIPAGKSTGLAVQFSASYPGDFFHILSIYNSYSGLSSQIAIRGTVIKE